MPTLVFLLIRFEEDTVLIVFAIVLAMMSVFSMYTGSVAYGGEKNTFWDGHTVGFWFGQAIYLTGVLLIILHVVLN